VICDAVVDLLKAVLVLVWMRPFISPDVPDAGLQLTKSYETQGKFVNASLLNGGSFLEVSQC
jgi:hypothetical protein